MARPETSVGRHFLCKHKCEPFHHLHPRAKRTHHRPTWTSLAVQIATHFTLFTHSGKLILHTHNSTHTHKLQELVEFNRWCCCWFYSLSTEKGRPVSCGEVSQQEEAFSISSISIKSNGLSILPCCWMHWRFLLWSKDKPYCFLCWATHAIQIHSQHTILLTQSLQSEFCIKDSKKGTLETSWLNLHFNNWCKSPPLRTLRVVSTLLSALRSLSFSFSFLVSLYVELSLQVTLSSRSSCIFIFSPSSLFICLSLR